MRTFWLKIKTWWVNYRLKRALRHTNRSIRFLSVCVDEASDTLRKLAGPLADSSPTNPLDLSWPPEERCQ